MLSFPALFSYPSTVILTSPNFNVTISSFTRWSAPHLHNQRRKPLWNSFLFLVISLNPFCLLNLSSPLFFRNCPALIFSTAASSPILLLLLLGLTYWPPPPTSLSYDNRHRCPQKATTVHSSKSLFRSNFYCGNYVDAVNSNQLDARQWQKVTVFSNSLLILNIIHSFLWEACLARL